MWSGEMPLVCLFVCAERTKCEDSILIKISLEDLMSGAGLPEYAIFDDDDARRNSSIIRVGKFAGWSLENTLNEFVNRVLQSIIGKVILA